jgi:hypothetical protein
MGFDTECDLIVEAKEIERLGRTILDLRNKLVAEHLDVERQILVQTLADHNGSLVATIEALRGEARSLKPFEAPDYGEIGESLAENELLDPEGVSSFGSRMRRKAQHAVPFRRRLASGKA